MNIKKLLLIGLSLFILVGCSPKGGSTSTKTNTYLTIAKAKDNVEYKFAKSWDIKPGRSEISSYSSELIEGGTKHRIDVTGGTKFSLIVSMDAKYDIKNNVFKYDGDTINDNTFTISSIRYHIYDVTSLKQKDVTLDFTYDVYIPDVEVTIASFIAPKTDPNNLYTSLYFNATVNGEVIKYQDDAKILASNLETALKAYGDKGKIKLTGNDKSIKLTGFFDKDDYFFNDILNVASLSKTEGYLLDAKCDYIDFKSIYEISPSNSCTFYLDFSNLDTKEYSKYTINSYFGRNMTQKIDYKEILVDGNKVDVLTNNTIKNASKVVINYDKSEFGLDDVSSFNGKDSDIAGMKFPYGGENPRTSRVEATKDTISIILKDSTKEDKPAIYWYSGWLDASVDARHNLIDNNVCRMDIAIFKIAQ